MKRIWTCVLPALALALLLCACGGNGDAGNDGVQAPDLKQYYEDYMASLDEAPMMMDLEEDTEILDSFYPGLTGYETRQLVAKTAAISAVASEFVLVETANESDAQAVAGILQGRVDSQLSGGVLYPMMVEAWENASVITKGNVVALICAGEGQDAAVAAFEALF